MNTSENPILQREGVLLLILSAAAYTAFLAREMGYTDHFSIPHEFIVASNTGLIIAAKSILWGALAYIGKVNLAWILAPRGDRLLHAVARHVIASSLVIGFAAYPYLQTDLSPWWVIGLIAIYLFFQFAWPLITQRKLAGYENKVAAQIEIEKNSTDILDTLLSGANRGTRIAILLAASIMIFAYGDGRRDAFQQSTYNVKLDEPDAALIRMYGEVAIFRKFIPNTKSLTAEIQIQKLSDGEPIKLKQADVGPLRKFSQPPAPAASK